MMNLKLGGYLKILLVFLLYSFALNLQASALPEGWSLVGNNPEGYDVGITELDGVPAPAAYIKSNDKVIDSKFSTLLQSFFPEAYLGKRIRLSTWIKTKNVEKQAGLWMRIDTKNRRAASFDMMRDRAISGTNDWEQFSIVLDVPKNSTKLGYGVLIIGAGEVLVDEFKFEIVDQSIATTENIDINNKPQNNSF